MSALLAAVIVLGIPIAALVALLHVVEWRQRRHAAVIARQIEVTDAIHREFGAIVAPTVHRARGGWRVSLPMDPRDPHTAAVVELAARTLGPSATVEVAVVAPWHATPPRRRRQSRERIASAMSA
jgi:hypothetical protein